MRQKKVFMILAIIVGILALSIAYAAIAAQTLNVNGNATAATSDANFDVRFTGDVTSTGDGTVTGYINTEKDPAGRTAELSISGLKVEGQKATGCINIINNSEGIKAVLTISSIIHENPTWYKITTELGETTYIDSGTGKPVLIPGETVPLYVTVELLKTPKNNEEAALAIDTATIKVNADAIDADAELGDYVAGGGGASGNACETCNGTGLCPGTFDYNGAGASSESCYNCGEMSSTNAAFGCTVCGLGYDENGDPTWDISTSYDCSNCEYDGREETLARHDGTTCPTCSGTGTSGGSDNGASVFTINGYNIENGGYNGTSDGCYAYAQLDCKEEDLTSYTGTLHIWPSSSTEEEATTHAMEVAQNEIPYIVQTSSALTLEAGTEYTYYMTFTNGTNTVKTPTKTYTAEEVCETCNGTGKCPGPLEPITGAGGEYCPGCGETGEASYVVYGCSVCGLGLDGSGNATWELTSTYGCSCGYDDRSEMYAKHDNEPCPTCSSQGPANSAPEYANPLIYSSESEELGIYYVARVDVSDADNDNVTATLYIWPSTSSETSASVYTLNAADGFCESGPITSLTGGVTYSWYISITDGKETVKTGTYTYTAAADLNNTAPEFTQEPYGDPGTYTLLVISCVHSDADGDTVTPKLYVWKTAEAQSTAVAYSASYNTGNYSEFDITGDLDPSTEYSYYVELSDGKTTTNSATKTFTTASMTVGTLTVDSYTISEGGFYPEGYLDGYFGYAIVVDQTANGELNTSGRGTLYIWPSTSSEESAVTYDMYYDGWLGNDSYHIQTTDALTLESGTEYTYYMTLTNGTDTVTTPTKTITPESDSGGDSDNTAPAFTQEPYIVHNTYSQMIIGCVHTDAESDTTTAKLYVWKTAEAQSTAVMYEASYSTGNAYSEFDITGDLDVSTEYSYYVELSDGKTTTNSEIQTFTSASMTVGALTINSFSLQYGQSYSCGETFYGSAEVIDTDGNGSYPTGTLYVWPTEDSQESAITYSFNAESGDGVTGFYFEAPYVSIDEGTEYSYYATFTNGTDTVTTPTKTYTPESDSGGEACETCNGTGICTGTFECYFTAGSSDSCPNCGQLDGFVIDYDLYRCPDCAAEFTQLCYYTDTTLYSCPVCSWGSYAVPEEHTCEICSGTGKTGG